MLKQVTLGSAGILLATAIFASSVNTGSVPAGASIAPAEGAPPVVTPPPVQVSKAPSPVAPSAAVAEDTGDYSFGAPMVSTKPVAETMIERDPIVTDPDSAVANGGRQYTAKNTPHNYPIPK